jgi:hypothetical protein
MPGRLLRGGWPHQDGNRDKNAQECQKTGFTVHCNFFTKLSQSVIYRHYTWKIPKLQQHIGTGSIPDFRRKPCEGSKPSQGLA